MRTYVARCGNMLLDVGTYRGLERLHVVVRDLVHQPSELGFLGREGVWPVRLGEDLSCKKRSLK